MWSIGVATRTSRRLFAVSSAKRNPGRAAGVTLFGLVFAAIGEGGRLPDARAV